MVRKFLMPTWIQGSAPAGSWAATSVPGAAGCGDQADLVRPDEVENALCIVWVDGEDMGSPPSACIRMPRRFTKLWPGVVVQRRRIHEKHVYPASPQLEGHGVPVFDQERHTEQGQQVAFTGRRGNRIERSKPKHARDPIFAVPLEVAQSAQRPLEMARSLSHPVVRVRRLHPCVKLVEVTAGARVLQLRRTQRHSPWGGSRGMYQAANAIKPPHEMEGLEPRPGRRSRGADCTLSSRPR